MVEELAAARATCLVPLIDAPVDASLHVLEVTTPDDAEPLLVLAEPLGGPTERGFPLRLHPYGSPPAQRSLPPPPGAPSLSESSGDANAPGNADEAPHARSRRRLRARGAPGERRAGGPRRSRARGQARRRRARRGGRHGRGVSRASQAARHDHRGEGAARAFPCRPPVLRAVPRRGTRGQPARSPERGPRRRLRPGAGRAALSRHGLTSRASSSRRSCFAPERSRCRASWTSRCRSPQGSVTRMRAGSSIAT